MVSILLPQEIEAELESVARQEHTTKTSLIKNAIAEFLDKWRQEEKITPYELGEDLFGVYEGDADLSTNVKTKIFETLNEKYPHSSHRPFGGSI